MPSKMLLSGRNEKIVKQLTDKLDEAKGDAEKIATIIKEYRQKAKQVVHDCEQATNLAIKNYEEASDLVIGIKVAVHDRIIAGRKEVGGRAKVKKEYLRDSKPYKD